MFVTNAENYYFSQYRAQDISWFKMMKDFYNVQIELQVNIIRKRNIEI